MDSEPSPTDSCRGDPRVRPVIRMNGPSDPPRMICPCSFSNKRAAALFTNVEGIHPTISLLRIVQGIFLMVKKNYLTAPCKALRTMNRIVVKWSSTHQKNMQFQPERNLLRRYPEKKPSIFAICQPGHANS